MKSTVYNESHVLHELKHYLPSQTPIKDFIHHNTLHAFQHMKFYDAIFKAGKIFGYQVTLELEDFRKLHRNGRIKTAVLNKLITDKYGHENITEWQGRLLTKKYDTHNEPLVGRLRAHWKGLYGIDIDNLVQPILFRILCSYLDQGISIWPFPVNKKGFLASIKELEKTSMISFFKSGRTKDLLMNGRNDLEDLLYILVGDENLFEQYIFDQQFSHPGWSGMVSAVEDAPHTLLDRKNISLKEMIYFELLLEIDAIDHVLNERWQPLAMAAEIKPTNLFDDLPGNELQEVIRLWHNAFEWSYYDDVLAGLMHQKTRPIALPAKKSFQAIFCIDERECSFRRHIENIDPDCETLGSPGFFGVEFFFQPENAKFYEKLCPAPVNPKYLVKELHENQKRKHELLYTNRTQTLLTGAISSVSLGFVAGWRLVQHIFNPKMSPAISNAYTHMQKNARLTVENKSPDDIENGLQIGFTIEEMAARVEGLIRGIGLVDNFAPIVYTIAHGSSSANNPHHSAHDCGACSGRPGSVNARVFAQMANHPEVRQLLNSKGIIIPASTQFLGGMHDTAADQIEFYDEHLLNAQNISLHKINLSKFEKALDGNAKERSRRFASINTKNSRTKVRRDILKRSVSMFEPRPELGHGTNSLCIVGNRSLTRGLFLDRRAFLNSYDYRTDPDGKLLMGVMRPIGLVCGGINLEYYFSRVDNYKLGAGTKLPHNVMGLIGVANSSDGDLRTGLPVQMIEVHDPVRLLVVVEHFPDIVLKAIQSAPEIFEWYKNEWVHIAAIHPETNDIHYYRDGRFSAYDPIIREVKTINDTESLVEDSKKMDTNHITDATKENLPVFILERN
ncbi:YbcC family protein [Flavihumibacter fluvii]|uniref:YbcC family protein n=1 Tax=Flavihumibacter fluvii TaxID=2838157 RepID=UPI001BDE5C38|nr:DUF2309 domain-containing protein [Flavihumibacter fluvii]ULQ52315.1 DUF2309 domain-containing protein [Flavihumibacter fluvii]